MPLSKMSYRTSDEKENRIKKKQKRNTNRFGIKEQCHRSSCISIVVKKDMNESTSEVPLKGLLEEVRCMLIEEPPTLKMKKAITSMLEIIRNAAIPPPPTATTSTVAEDIPSRYDVDLCESECVICGVDEKGSFHKRGFKCIRCKGLTESRIATALIAPSLLGTSAVRTSGFTFLSSQGVGNDSAAGGPSTGSGVLKEKLSRYSCMYLPLEAPQEILRHSDEALRRLRQVTHPNIALLYAVAKDVRRRNVCYLHQHSSTVQENTFQGSNAEQFRVFVASSLQAAAQLHAADIVHGDLRLQNFVQDEDNVFKVRHALFSSRLADTFTAPEVDRSNYQPTKMTDLFTLGATFKRIIEILRYNNITEDGEDKRTNTSAMDLLASTGFERSLQDATNLVGQMMLADPIKRCTAVEALRHPFLVPVRFSGGVPVETKLLILSSANNNVALQNTAGSFVFDPESTATFEELKRSDTANRESNGVVEGANILENFFREHGPLFQLVPQLHGSGMVLYSVRSDPRRRASRSHF